MKAIEARVKRLENQRGNQKVMVLYPMDNGQGLDGRWCINGGLGREGQELTPDELAALELDNSIVIIKVVYDEGLKEKDNAEIIKQSIAERYLKENDPLKNNHVWKTIGGE